MPQAKSTNLNNVLSVLLENSDLIVINKPAGISVHGDGKSTEKTIADWILETYPEIKDVGELKLQVTSDMLQVMRPGIVHRLDKDTSGCLIVAKTQTSYDYLKSQFQSHAIQKEYHAFCYGWLKEDSGTIDIPIARSTSDIRKWTAGRGKRGVEREALTEYEVIRRFGEGEYQGVGSTEVGTYSYVKAWPKTGRTHQIRVHLQYLNHPIVSDTLYASNREPALGFTRQALHARSIVWQAMEGGEIRVEAPFPEDFLHAIALAEKGVS